MIPRRLSRLVGTARAPRHHDRDDENAELTQHQDADHVDGVGCKSAHKVGVPLLTRSVHGVQLTEAGRVFLDHARLALMQAEAATEGARRAAQPSKQVFAIGFTTGQEVDWLPRATRLLRNELANIEIRVSSDHSATLADEFAHGRLDVAFLRAEQMPDIEFRVVAQEPLVAVLPSDHRLAQRKTFDPQDLVGKPISASRKCRACFARSSAITSIAMASRSRRRSRSTTTRWRSR
jgi:DNA-binding transcriptional LysR family regulator